MGWMSQQSIYKRERELFEKNYYGQLLINEQYDDFLEHLEELNDVAKRIDEAVRNEVLTENQPLIMFFYEGASTISFLSTLVVILRDDGFVYFGGREVIATLGLGGRTKNGQIEFYDQYKDQIDAYIAGDNK